MEGAPNPLELSVKRIVSSRRSAEASHNNGNRTLRMFLAASVSGAIHYGWGLQITILTPYAQILGVPHVYASLICSSGPLAGIVVNPMISYYSDRCTMRMGRRRPFILVGCLLISISAMIIAFSSDIGHYLGDPKEKCGVFRVRKGACAMLIAGFWLLDLANNTIRGVTQAMMDDLSVGHKNGPQTGYWIFSGWGGLGIILGFAAGATEKWPEWFPWLKTGACCGVCINIKGAFLTSLVLTVIGLTLTMTFADEKAIDTKYIFTSTIHPFSNPFNCLNNMSSSITKLFILTTLSWLALYPFFIYSTDWMGREIYHGNPRGSMETLEMYNNGFRKGCIGMICCAIFRTSTTLLIRPLCLKLPSTVVWSLGNFLLFLLMLAAAIISHLSTRGHTESLSNSLVEPDPTLEALALGIFVLMGIPTAMTQCLPMAIAFTIAVTEGGGQTIGAIAIAIAVPQLITVLATGPIDDAYDGGGNALGFLFSAALAFLSWFLGLFFLSQEGGISSKLPSLALL